MPRTLRAILAAWLVVSSWQVQADPMKPLVYPQTRRVDVAEVQFG